MDLFLEGLECDPFLAILEESEDYVYLKNLKGEFVFSNPAHLRLMGFDRVDQIYGKTDFDFVLPFLALRFQQQDREVFKGKSLRKQVELLSKEGNHSFWHLTTKLPLRSSAGKIVGLIGYTRKLGPEGLQSRASTEVARSLRYLQENFSEKIKVSEIAKIACLSVSALERRFQKEIGMSPSNYLKNLRMNEACRLLSETQESIAKIALDCGACDQAYFTVEFRKQFQITPLHYRKGFFGKGNALGKT